MTKTIIIPKSMSSFLVIMQLCFGIDLGFIKYLNARIQPAAKFISVLISLHIIIMMIMCTLHNEHNRIWIVLALVQYTSCFLILKFSKYSFYDFIMNVNCIDGNIPELKNESLGIQILVYSVLMVIAKLLTNCMARSEFFWNHTLIPYYVYVILILGIDLMSVIFILINYYIYCCVKHVKQLIMTSQISIKQLQKYYYDVVICYEKIMTLYDNLITIQLLFDVPKLMITVYMTLLFIHYNNTDAFLYAIEFIYSMHMIIHIIGPSIVTELIKSQVEAIKLELHDLLLKETDEKKSCDIHRLLRYMEARRLEHKVWRVIPIDRQLPLTVLNICVTYLIVIIQFTHLYG